MSSSEIDLQLATRWMTLIVLFILIFLGPIGSLCNIIIFTSKELKKNSCAFYFLCTAIFELPTLCLGIITRLATENFGSTLINQNQMFCKIRSYLITAMGTVATYFVLLASIDRCMATSIHVRYRAFSQIKIAYRIAAATIIIGMSINIHVFIFFDVQSLCIPQPGVYSFFYSSYLIIWTGIVPNVLTLSFSLWTIKNIKQTRQRIAPNQGINTAQQRHMRKMESQLVIMMLAEAFSSIIIDLTRVSCYSFYFLTLNTPKNNFEKIVAIFIFQFSNILLFLNYSKSFYIYTLTSSLYRKIFYRIIQNYYVKILKILKLKHEKQIHITNVKCTKKQINLQIVDQKEYAKN